MPPALCGWRCLRQRPGGTGHRARGVEAGAQPVEPGLLRLRRSRLPPLRVPGRPRPRQSRAAQGASLAGSLEFFSGLVATARNSELGRTARAMHWNRTTRTLLMSAADAGRRYAGVHEALASLAHGRVAEARLPELPRARLAVRARAAAAGACAALVCAAAVGAGRRPRRVPGCWRAAPGRCGAYRVRIRSRRMPVQAAKVGERLSVEELVSLGTSLARLLDASGQFRRYVDEPLRQAGESRGGASRMPSGMGWS